MKPVERFYIAIGYTDIPCLMAGYCREGPGIIFGPDCISDNPLLRDLAGDDRLMNVGSTFAFPGIFSNEDEFTPVIESALGHVREIQEALKNVDVGRHVDIHVYSVFNIANTFTVISAIKSLCETCDVHFTNCFVDFDFSVTDSRREDGYDKENFERLLAFFEAMSNALGVKVSHGVMRSRHPEDIFFRKGAVLDGLCSSEDGAAITYQNTGCDIDYDEYFPEEGVPVLIDTPFKGHFDGVDELATYKAAFEVIARRQGGGPLYFKPHYLREEGDIEKIATLYDGVVVVNKYIPADILCLKSSSLYFFISTAVKIVDDPATECICLLDWVVYRDKQEEAVFRSHFSSVFTQNEQNAFIFPGKNDG